MQVVVDDLITNCELTGTGKLVLLLHGWGDSLQGLSELQAALASNYNVLAVDLPGFGATEAPKSVWDLDDYSHFIRNLLKKLDLGELFAVIGHSNGGALAIRATSLGLLKPKRIVLLAASGVRTNQAAKRFAFKVMAKTGNAATILLPHRYRQALRKSLYTAAGSDLLVMPQLQETFKKTVRQDVQADAGKITVPTLLIYAKHDPSVPAGSGQRYHQLIADSKLEIIDGSGHFIHAEQPAKVIGLIERFLK
ncbi:MAG TPA: alpha/beta hydrolase [Candidatus Dormibacteraeota bacterium]|nr:alpha/beta hydrolase [Candidatus Dormibacteraeota bacterium]